MQDVPVKDVEKTKIDQFASNVRGRVIRPGDDDYEQARKVYNGMIDKRPGLIASCADVADVITAVNFARDNRVTVAIRGGGHNGGGLGICDDGLVIDLSRMKGVRVDPKAKTVRAEGGCVWGDVDHATHAFGMAAPAGVISTTGVGGLTLGGGIGHLTRKYGLTIDNLESVDLVLADGRFVTANEKENDDLFWAVRGGGGNFGVVTSFLFKLQPVDIVYAGPILWHLDQGREVMEFFRGFIAQASEDITGFFAFLVVPPGPPFPEHLHNKRMCGIVCCYTGALNAAEEAFKPVRRLGTPALDFAGPLPYPALQSMFDPIYPPGLQWYWRADFVNKLSDEAIALHLKHGNQLPSMHSTMHLYPINGAVHRVGKNDTAFSYRDSMWAEVIVGVDPNPSNMTHIIPWVKRYWEELHPHSAGGAYVNFMMEEGQERVQATYRDNYERLVAVKNRHDPTNLFHVNQNVRPSVNAAQGAGA
ncbi:MAG TPA: FAD-binding oxidoreductase [Terriglobia bacterium]|nr:FAD-binding oxidoreductase [Terriglobia bacterium]